MRDPENILLETFLIIAETQNLFSAASILKVSQPTLTQRLHKLENFLGAPLFDRDSRPMKLTNLGQNLMDNGRSLLDHNKEFWENIKQITKKHQTLLKLGMPDSLSEIMGAECLTALSDVADRIELKSGISPWLENSFHTHKFDLAIDAEPFSKDFKNDAFKLFNDPFILVTPNTWESISLKELVKSKPLVGYGRTSKFGNNCTKIVANLGVNYQPKFSFDSTQSLLRFVQAGHGWAATSALCLFQSPNALKDISIRKCPNSEFRTFSLLYRKKDFELANKASEKFISVFHKLTKGPWSKLSTKVTKMLKETN